jgi:tetratricopeptide (TPR) repeat protein
MAEDATAELPEELQTALDAAEADPAQMAHWDRLEELAEEAQRPDEVGAMYRAVLGRDLAGEEAEALGERAAAFHEEWFSEDSPYLLEVLSRVLTLRPTADWALQRITVVLTVNERWDELLGFYDRALAAADDDLLREQLLDEASGLAKDFAGAPDRAIDYLQQLRRLRPKDGRLGRSLERLLERQGRWEELITLWREGLPQTSGAEALEVRGRIAHCYLEQLGDAAATLREVEALLDEGGSEPIALGLLERVVALDSATEGVRAGALEILRARCAPDEIIRVLGVALPHAEGEALVDLHRELGHRLAAAGDASGAVGHLSEVLHLDPSDLNAQEELQRLSAEAGEPTRYADALVAAADATAGRRQIELLVEAAEARTRLEDPDAAIHLSRRILASEASPEVKRLVARRLSQLLAATGQSEDRLGILDTLAGLETDPVDRSRALGAAARLAEELGDSDRALALWEQRLEADPADLEALDAEVALTEKEGRWERHVATLERRLAADASSAQRRLDLAKMARAQADALSDVDGAIETWRRVQADFGDDAETVDALFDLLVRAGRYDEIYEVLGRAVDRDGARAAEVLARVGDVCREHLGRLDEAAKAYHRAIQMEPRLERAREGLRALVEVPEARASALQGLARACELTDDWEALVGLLEDRLELAGDDSERVDLLIEASTLQEQRGEDPAAAFEALRRAVALAPQRVDLEQDLTRLAEATGRFGDLADALASGAEALAEERPERAADVFRHLGQVSEDRLEDPRRALEAWNAALVLEPHDADTADQVVRLGAVADRWDVAAAGIVRFAAKRNVFPTDLMDAVDGLAEASEHTRALADGLTAAVPGPGRVDAELGRAFEARIGDWLVGRCDDPTGAEAAYLRALAHQRSHGDTLRALARIQWQEPGPALVATLLGLAELSEENLDPLYDAARLTLDPIGHRDRGEALLQRLLRSARRLWERGEAATGEHPPDAMAVYALDELVALLLDADRVAEAVDLLVDGSRLPVDPERSRAMRRQAGELAKERLGDQERALRLLQSVVDESLDDAQAVRQLGELLQERQRLPELLALRQRQLTLDLDPATRLDARLEVARVLGLIEETGGPIRVLRANLQEEPGHGPSLESLASLLDERGRHLELAQLLQEQATAMESRGDAPRAAEFWSRAAQIQERPLNNIDAAMNAHRRVVGLEAEPGLLAPSLDALARLSLGRGEPASAAEWLQQRLDVATNDERLPVAMRLAQAHLEAGADPQAVLVFERILEADPGWAPARARLAELYRRAESWEPLARLLADGADLSDDADEQLAMVREAAALYDERLSDPAAAIPVLRRGVELAPDDQQLRIQLAIALREGGELEEARAILNGLIDAFGRRRSSERAEVHYELALTARADGDLEEAMAELDKARQMDLKHPGILRMSGRMAREAGQLERAEKAFRALLLVVRRQDPGAEDVTVGASEVLHELSSLARQQGEAAQADELVETAVHTAAEHDAETIRFKKALLREEGDAELALRVLDARLNARDDLKNEGVLRAHRADVLEGLGRSEEAFAELLAALSKAPSEEALHLRARELAKNMGAIERYVSTLEELVDGTDDPAFGTDLLLRLGPVVEQDLGDLDRAGAVYARVEEYGLRKEEAWLALARVADARGDSAEEVRVLRRLVDVEDESIPAEARIRALYRIAEVELATGALGAGLDTLQIGLEREPRYARAGAILQGTLETVPEEAEERPRLLRLFEQVARASGEPELILDLLERQVAQPYGTIDQVREGVEKADLLQADDRAEALLTRGVDIAREGIEGLAAALWIPQSLAERRQAAGDFPAALEWLQQAAEVAPEDEAFMIWLRVAEMASADGGDLALAAGTYEQLLAGDPSNRELFGPLLELYTRLQDRDGLERITRQTVDALLDPGERNQLRYDLAVFLRDVAGAEADAVAVFNEVLDDDPDHLEAAQGLLDIFEKNEDSEQLVELLYRQLDRARDRQDVEAICALTLRMGHLQRPTDRYAAMDSYRAGLDWAPEDRPLLRALIDTFDDADDDLRDKAQLVERLLQLAEGDEASALTRQLIGLYETLDDEYGVGRAIDLGFRSNPGDLELRNRLEAHYRQTEDWSELASTIETDAAHREDPTEAAARFLEAAEIHRTGLQSPARAAELVRRAIERTPDDLALLEVLVKDMVEAGLESAAAGDVADALERYGVDGEERPRLLRMRARLELAVGDVQIALEDLEEAYAIDPAGTASALADGLERIRQDAMSADDGEAEARTTHRLVELLTQSGRTDEARDLLAAWSDRSPEDVEALRTLRDMDAAAERWEDVARHEERRVQAERGDAQVEAALGLANAFRRLERPGDARFGLEEAYRAQPEDVRLRDALRSLYEETGELVQLAQILLADADAAEDDDARFDLLRRAGELRTEVGDPEGALECLAQAAALKPDDHDLVIALADAYMGSGRLQEAVELLQESIGGFKRQRSPHLAAMQLRMARIAAISGDPETQKEWLNVAMDADKNNPDVAAELSQLALDMGDDETALKALRVVTLQKADGPMSKAMAFLRQAQIVHRQGDTQKAVLWARRARLEDEDLAEAQEFLESVGEG